ncbi:uncharacterized protein METZ01_LOCUS249942, partial [marine metagenome]
VTVNPADHHQSTEYLITMLAQLLRVAPEYPQIEESTIERNL